LRISAILVINQRPLYTGLIGDFPPQEGREPSRGSTTCAEILGQSVLDRTVARLRNAGIRTISVIGGPAIPSVPEQREVEIIVTGRSCERWQAAQQTVREQGAQGIETVLMIGLGAYMELNVADALEFHCAQGTPLTQLQDNQGPLDFWIVDSHWFRTAATGCSLPFRYGEFPGLPVPCRMRGYVNRLAEARDLRRLVLDTFLSRCEIRPRGQEVRPGIWMDDGARVHKCSRLVAPVYLGRSTKVEHSAVITRFSNVERHCQVGEGTVVDGATVLPHTALGRGLEVSQAVVDGTKFVDLDRNVALEIDDSNLIRDIAPRHSRVPVHREYTSQPNRAKDAFEFEYVQYLSRAAGRLSE
jgi:carbonic anhydrase/acetyltransferase-like protein (isoleucine patch superfamily)